MVFLSHKRGWVVAAAAWLMTVGTALRPAAAGEAELTAALDALPADTSVAFVVPNAKALSDKIAKLGQTLGVPSPEMDNVLLTLKDKSGLTAGVRDDGAVVVALVGTSWIKGVEKQAQAEMGAAPGAPAPEAAADATASPHDGQPQIIAILPITNAQAFIGNFQDVHEENGITIGRNVDGQTLYIKTLQDTAVVSDVQDLAAHYHAAGQGAQWIAKAGPSVRSTLHKTDAAVLVNVEMMASKLLPLVDDALQEMSQNLEQAQAMGGGDPAAMGMAKAVIALYGDAAKALVRDTQVAVEAVDLSDQGVGLSIGAQFKSDSYLAKVVKKGTPAALQWKQVVEGNYLFASAMSLDGLDMKTIITDLTTRLNGMEKDLGWLSATVKILPAYQNVHQITGVYYVPQQVQMGAPLFTGVTVMDTSDPDGIIKALQDYLAAMNQMKMPVGPAPDANSQPEEITFTTSYQPAAVTVEGVAVDQYTWQTQFPPSAMQNNPVLPMLSSLGFTGQTGYVARVDNKIVTITNTDAQLLGATIKTLHGQGPAAGALHDNQPLQSVRAEGLPEQPMAESYFHLGGLAGMVSPFLAMGGIPPINVPNDLPPVAMGLAVGDQSSVTARMYVPTKVMTFVRDTIQQIQQAHQGGGPGNQPQHDDGNPPPPPF